VNCQAGWSKRSSSRALLSRAAVKPLAEQPPLFPEPLGFKVNQHVGDPLHVGKFNVQDAGLSLGSDRVLLGQ
jgi:hypothetical protein